jgi:hypothetical protein
MSCSLRIARLIPLCLGLAACDVVEPSEVGDDGKADDASDDSEAAGLRELAILSGSLAIAAQEDAGRVKWVSLLHQRDLLGEGFHRFTLPDPVAMAGYDALNCVVARGGSPGMDGWTSAPALCLLGDELEVCVDGSSPLGVSLWSDDAALARRDWRGATDVVVTSRANLDARRNLHTTTSKYAVFCSFFSRQG